MTARPPRLSSSEPSVLMATSNRLTEAPNSSIAGSSVSRLACSSAVPSRTLIDSAAGRRRRACAESPDDAPGNEEREDRAGRGGQQNQRERGFAELVARLHRRDVSAPDADQDAENHELDSRGPDRASEPMWTRHGALGARPSRSTHRSSFSASTCSI